MSFSQMIVQSSRLALLSVERASSSTFKSQSVCVRKLSTKLRCQVIEPSYTAYIVCPSLLHKRLTQPWYLLLYSLGFINLRFYCFQHNDSQHKSKCLHTLNQSTLSLTGLTVFHCAYISETSDACIRITVVCLRYAFPSLWKWRDGLSLGVQILNELC
jgi:hypothetical protein